MNPAGVYVGRFAPSPTGPLHDGSLVAALASWLDARAHGGLWLVRLEDVDSTRCRPGLAQIIVQQLGDCGLVSDLPPICQSQRHPLYQAALEVLVANGVAYPCGCTRQEIAAAIQHNGQHKIRHGELIYPGTCRSGLNGRLARAWRFDTGIYITNQPVAPVLIAQAAMQTVAVDAIQDNRQRSNTGHSGPPIRQPLRWHDRRLGAQQQDVAAEVGDFILHRADGCFAYQLAVVVDDAAQGITDVVRGQDLADNTARQMLLQRALGLPTPRYLHTPLVLGHNGEKLSKQNGAQALDLSDPLRTLNRAAAQLALPPYSGSLSQALQAWTAQWRNIYPAQI